ncbi:MAG: hypothetical protein JSW25_05490 [Thermoplasmata archaeon]|nr:MAG: hypothetical protein JSW25_05490 [Thermoplasmata archaeon]
MAALLQATDLAREGRPMPDGAPPRSRLAKLSNKGWMILSKAAKELGVEASTLERAAKGCAVIQVAPAEPPRLLGIFKRKPEPAARWTPGGELEAKFHDDPVAMAECAKGHQVLAARVAPIAAKVRSRSVPGKLRRPPKSQRYVPPTPTREALLMRVDRSLVARYAQEEAGEERRRRPPRSPLRFSDGYPAKDLSSAIRLLVTADAGEVADRMRNGTLAEWFRDEAGETDLAAVVDAATHTARERRASDEETRALLLRYIRRTPIGSDLERGLIEPMAEALRSRDGALVASTAQALLLLDSDLAASELSSALFETEVAGRPAVLEALGETGSPRAVAALERLAQAATLEEDREGALAALRKLASEGTSQDVASAALERLGQD